jgi:hypothetical protein
MIMSKVTSSTSVLRPGTPAPNFTLHSAPDKSMVLNQFRGHPTILAFYPADFSPVCGDQMTLGAYLCTVSGTGPEGLEPSTYCSAGSHSIQTELWTLLKEMIFRYMNFPFFLCGIMRSTVSGYFLVIIRVNFPQP